jgi:Retrotransposon gag protein
MSTPAEELEALKALVSELQTKVTTLEASPTPLRSVRSVSPPITPFSSLKVKTAIPDAFHGSRSKLRSFLSQLNIYFALQSSVFTSDKTKVMFAASLLKDSAFDWIEPHLRKIDQNPPPAIIESYPSFVRSLEATFGDIDAKATAERQLRSLAQTGSASSYATSFQQIVSFLEWDDAALCFAFYNGLKDSIKDELARDERPSPLSALMEKAIKIDNRLFERQREKSFGRSTAVASLASNSNSIGKQQSFKPTQFVARSSSLAHAQQNQASGPSTQFSRPQSNLPSQAPVQQSTPRSFAPINTSNSRSLRSSGKIPDTERAHRIQNNLCLYCGQAGHVLKNCPTLATKNESVNATQTPLIEDITPSFANFGFASTSQTEEEIPLSEMENL